MLIGRGWPARSRLNYSRAVTLFLAAVGAGSGAPPDDCGERPPQEVAFSDVSLHAQSSRANVWNTLRMASAGPVGKSHTVTFDCGDRDGGVNWERQTGKSRLRRDIYSYGEESLAPDSEGSAEHTLFRRTAHTGSVKAREHGSSWLCCVGKFMFVTNQAGINCARVCVWGG